MNDIQPTPDEHHDHDVLVVGGGPAGLAAATALARSRRTVVVVDAGEPRNAPAAGAHNVLGQEGVAPQELLARGRAEATSYGAQVRSDRATGVRRVEDGFVLDLASGATLAGRRLVLATGLVDELPDLPGLRDGWGHDVLHCPFCHGWEVRDQRIGVLGTGPGSVHQVLLFAQLSDRVTYLRHDAPPLEPAQVEELAALGVEVVQARIDHLRRENGELRAAVPADGDEVSLDALAVAPRFVARAELYEQLGGSVATHPWGGTFVPVQERGATDLPGVFVAGNTADLSAVVVAAMAAGVAAGGAVHMDLLAEDLRRAVTARHAG